MLRSRDMKLRPMKKLLFSWVSSRGPRQRRGTRDLSFSLPHTPIVSEFCNCLKLSLKGHIPGYAGILRMKRCFLAIFTVCYLFVLFTVFPCGPSLAKEELKDVFEKGVDYLQRQMYTDARIYFRKAIAMNPDFYPAYNYLGLAYFMRKDDVYKAIYYFKKSVKLNPQYATAYSNMGMAYSYLEDWGGAVESFKKALEITPDDFNSNYYVAWAYLTGTDEPAKAADHFFKVTRMQSRNGLSWYGLGLAYTLSDQRPQALEAITVLKSLKEDLLAAKIEEIMRRYDSGLAVQISEPEVPLPANPPASPQPLSPIQPTYSSSPAKVKMSGTATISVQLKSKEETAVEGQ